MIDLHMHTKYSDGTDSIEEIVDKWIANKCEIASITDHDSIAGIEYLKSNKILMEKLKKHNIRFVNGIEFSAIIKDNKIHLLGYDFDCKNKELLELIQLGQEKRLKKFEMRINALKEQFGIEYSDKSLQELREQCDFVGKPIMARYMVKDGICDDYELCFTKYLNPLILPNVETRVEAEKIIPAISHSGGQCVWAHPYGGIGEPKIDINKVEEIINLLIPLGLKGLECYYNLYTNEEISQLIILANKYNLKISAGSDYHGNNKKVPLGKLCLDNDIILDRNQVSLIDDFKNI